MRTIDKVIDDILKIVPKTIDDYDDFYNRLNDIPKKIKYVAPELVPYLWKSFSYICYYYLHKYKDEKWNLEVRYIINPNYKT